MLITLVGALFFPGRISAQVDVSDIFLRQIASAPGTMTSPDEGFQRREMTQRVKAADIFFEPSNRELRIKTPGDVMLQEIQLMDLSGNRFVLPEARVQNYTHTLTAIPAGYYVLRVKSSAGWETKNICLL
jgi:hypothetical protein